MTDNRPVNSELLWKIQKRLVALGYDLGTYGPNGDGVDGDLGPPTYWDESRTLNAIAIHLETDKVEVEPPLPRVASQTGRRVFLDIGHGQKPTGFDPGAVHALSGITEHQLNLHAARGCEAVLRRAFVEVRIDDSNRKNYTAGRAAEGFDVFVSLHHNAHDKPAQGAEAIYHRTKGGAADHAMAELAAAEVAKELGIPNRGKKDRRVSVVSGAEDAGALVAILMEFYFMHEQSPDNPPPAEMLDWSERGGAALGRAILKHLGITAQ